MSTLLLRLAAPLQAWGLDSKFNIRKTGNVPSKSGVIGLLAAALGRGRNESIDDLAALRFGVRVVRPGKLLCDYHTVSRDPNPRPALNHTDYVTKRYYLSDAVFIAGLEGMDTEYLKTLEEALRRPAYPLFLGRRCCPPTLPISLGIVEQELQTALLNAQCSETLSDERTESVHLVMDARQLTRSVAMIQDMPLSFSQKKREYGFRPATEQFVLRPVHDPFCELEG